MLRGQYNTEHVMERLNLTPEILRKYGIPYDIVKSGDVLGTGKVKVQDVYYKDTNRNKLPDIFPKSDKPDEGFWA